MGACSKAVDRSHPGTRKLRRLEDNLGAADVALTSGELRELNDALARIEISGDRYPAEYAKKRATDTKETDNE